MGTKKRCLMAKAIKAAQQKEIEQLEPDAAAQQFADYLNAKAGRRLPQNMALEQAAKVVTLLIIRDAVIPAKYSEKVMRLFYDASIGGSEQRLNRLLNLAMNFAYEQGKAAASTGHAAKTTSAGSGGGVGVSSE